MFSSYTISSHLSTKPVTNYLFLHTNTFPKVPKGESQSLANAQEIIKIVDSLTILLQENHLQKFLKILFLPIFVDDGNLNAIQFE